MDMASWPEWFRTALFRALRVFLITVRWERFATPQTLAFAQILPSTLRRLSLPDCWNEHIARSNAFFFSFFFWQNSYFVLITVCLSHPVMCLCLHDYPRSENRREKVKINQIFSAADDRRLAADTEQPISIEFSTSFAMHCGQNNGLSRSNDQKKKKKHTKNKKNNNRRLAI